SLIEPDAMPQLKNVVQDVNGATDSVYLDSSVKFGLVEVKAGFGERKGGGPTDMIPEGVAQVVAYATALKAAKLPGVAILMVDSGAWKKLSLDQRTAALAATKAVGAYITLHEGFAVAAKERARRYIRALREE